MPKYIPESGPNNCIPGIITAHQEPLTESKYAENSGMELIILLLLPITTSTIYYYSW